MDIMIEKIMSNKKIYKLLFCAVLATIFALTTHIYLSEWMNPFLDSMSEGLNMNPDPNTYSHLIIYAAYGTAFLTTGLLVFFYYHTQHLIPGHSKWIKTLIVSAILFCVKGEPIRQPIMNIILNYNIGIEHPFTFVALQNIDKWVALFLLAVCLVYLCPQKNRVA